MTLADDGTYGWKMNKEETLKVAVEALETGVPYEGGCIWDQKAASTRSARTGAMNMWKLI